MRITLSKVELDYCKFYTIKKTLDSHVDDCLIKTKGMVGVGKWLESFLDYTKLQKNYETFTNFHRKGDLSVNGREIIIRSHHTSLQQRHINAIVIWTTIEDDIVILQGWNYTTDENVRVKDMEVLSILLRT
jgi:uncharacterized cysteine cluster protein YcgN (CxxCxxCC family)